MTNAMARVDMLSVIRYGNGFPPPLREPKRKRTPETDPWDEAREGPAQHGLMRTLRTLIRGARA